LRKENAVLVQMTSSLFTLALRCHLYTCKHGDLVVWGKLKVKVWSHGCVHFAQLNL